MTRILPGGLVDLHTHFLPDRVLRKVWAFFDRADEHYGVPWPIHYRLPQDERVATLRALGVTTFAPLVYAHRPGMAAWLNDWVGDFAAGTPGAVPTATFYPEPGVEGYLGRALEAGARVVKLHVQVGGFDPRETCSTRRGGCSRRPPAGRRPLRGRAGGGPWTGLDVFEQVLRRHPRLVAVLAHAGMPDYEGAVDLTARYPRVHLDTTMVGTAFTEAFAPLPPDWTARLAGSRTGSSWARLSQHPVRLCEQLEAVGRWAQDRRLGEPFRRAVLRETPLRLLAADLRLPALLRLRCSTPAASPHFGSVRRPGTEPT